MYSIHQKSIKNKVQIRNDLFKILAQDDKIKKSALGEVMLGKSKATPEVNIPPPLPQLIQNSPLPGINALHLSQEACEAIQVSTMDQSENPIWFEQRKGRLTASIL